MVLLWGRRRRAAWVDAVGGWVDVPECTGRDPTSPRRMRPPGGDMELSDVMRTCGAVREFTDEPVRDEQLLAVLDVARFAPSGGNRQGWRLIVVGDPTIRRS